MSTTYYYKNKENKELNDILSDIKYENVFEAAYEEYYKETKIGQSSMGWVFLIYGDITLEELYENIKDKHIIDEYERDVSVDELFELIKDLSDRKHRTDYPQYFKARREMFNGIKYVYDVMVGEYE